MVVSHIPSNLCLIALPFAPNLNVADRAPAGPGHARPDGRAHPPGLRDGPGRPRRATAAAAYTGTARYIARPLAPLVNAPIQAIAPGAGFIVAGTLKTVYDLVLWRWFRRVPLPEDERPRVATG